MAACTSQAISGLTRKIPVGLTEMEHTGCNRPLCGHELTELLTFGRNHFLCAK